MPAKEQRKVMKHGTSGVVAIPKAYRDYHKLDPGSIVTVLYDSLLLIVPKGRENLLQEKAELIDQLLGQSTQETRS
ncbi:AbrB/MazE/SpoVT family DNA-binding domain-containing protein [Candidatus Bathyarchaeota archaeon A05DMB-2]|nr:AbrB/MazE/SpoVT family DNA-binding domain-containing protein [Candidatus Bathyarchaeota archaeon A05DMB-2]